MTDREMIDLAAKAAGITLEYRHGSDAYYYDDPDTGREEWNPILNDGQSLRLAVKCGISIYAGTYRAGCDVVPQEDEGNIVTNENYDDDPYAATRKAITRAAAEIGKAMP